MDFGDKAKEFMDKAKDVVEDVKDRAEEAFEHAKETFAAEGDHGARPSEQADGARLDDGTAWAEQQAADEALSPDPGEPAAVAGLEPNDLADAQELNVAGEGFERDPNLEQAEAAVDNPENPVP